MVIKLEIGSQEPYNNVTFKVRLEQDGKNRINVVLQDNKGTIYRVFGLHIVKDKIQGIKYTGVSLSSFNVSITNNCVVTNIENYITRIIN